jgi:type I restriction-modification system DNA methylase subunit
MVQKVGVSFVQSVLTAFKKINSEISIDSLEHDFSPRFVKYVVEGVLGYSGTEYAFERGRTDITLLDENNNRVVVIETKRPKEDLNEEKWRNQAGKYADSSTRFVGLTNGYRFILWEKPDDERILKVDIDFKQLIVAKKTKEEKLTTRETEQILFISNISKTEVWSASKYSLFDSYYAKIDVSDTTGFNQLIDQLRHLTDDLLRQYTYETFDDYFAGFAGYKQELNELQELKKGNGNDKKQAADLARVELKIEGKYKKFSSFSGFYIWKALSNRNDDNEEENKQVFCEESIYVLLNRLLFIRICEDKGLLSKKISNGGIERLREQLTEPVLGDTDIFKQIVQFSYNGAKNIYFHFYEEDNPLDWYKTGDGDLDRVLNRVLWTLNQFNFANVNTDILGRLYEKYLPKEERKRLGEFYTPDEVIDYILDSVGYVPSKAIENKLILDPACGSGGFLIRATRRLIARYAVKYGKATPLEAMDTHRWDEVYERLTPSECEEIIKAVTAQVHGFDINPFATSISEMNLLFQVVDLYFKAVKGDKSFKVPRFQVYETDSLETPNDQSRLTYFLGSTGKSLAKDKDAIDNLKKKKYDFIVGNPPWLGILKIGKQTARLYSNYAAAKGKFDIYALFIELGAKMLAKNGKLGYITQNRFMKASYAKSLREYLSKNVAIRQILDFGDLKIFSDATNYPCILVLENDSANNFIHVQFYTEADRLTPEDLLNLVRKHRKEISFSDDYLNIQTVSQASLSGKSWDLHDAHGTFDTHSLPNLLTLKAYTEKIMQGVTCGGKGSDNIYYITPQNAENSKIEEKVKKKVIRGKDIRRFLAENNAEELIYPYDTGSRAIDLRLFPGTSRYLNQFKDKLSNRVLDGKNIKDWNKQWFELWRPRESQVFERQKIVCPRIAEKNRFALDDSGAFLSDSAVAIIPKNIDIYLLLGLLNSRLAEEFIMNTSPYVQGRYYNYSKTYIERIPVKLPKTDREIKIAKEIIVKVKEIIRNKRKNGETETASIEAEIDRLVFDLYGVSSDVSQQ